MTTFASQRQTVTLKPVCQYSGGKKEIGHRSLNNIFYTIYEESTSQQAVVKTRMIIDITTKEYTNHSTIEEEKTSLRVKKKLFSSKKNQYQFRPLDGVNRRMGGNIAAK